MNSRYDFNIDVILNCILVNENVRPAMLVQPADYKEANHEGPKMKYIIEGIQKMFPYLIVSSQYENYQGVIISKMNYNGKKDISLVEMGKLLGYPCYQDFDATNNLMMTELVILYRFMWKIMRTIEYIYLQIDAKMKRK